MTLRTQMGRCNSVNPFGVSPNQLAVPQLQRPLCGICVFCVLQFVVARGPRVWV